MSYTETRPFPWPKLMPRFCAVTAVVLAPIIGAAVSILTFDPDDHAQLPQGSIGEPDNGFVLPHEDPIAQAIAGTTGRVLVAPGETDYSAIGKITFAGGGHCSGQPVYFEGYRTPNGILASTAGHCLIGKAASDVSFTKTYTNAAGDVKTFTTSITPQIWINPSYQSDPYITDPKTGEKKLRTGDDDNALLFFPNETLPAEIQPVEQYAFSWHMGEYNSYKIGLAEKRAAGYAADLSSQLSADEKCDNDIFSEGEAIWASCVTNTGGSGSALLASDVHNPNYSLAVLSGVTAIDGEANIFDENLRLNDAFRSIYAPFYHYQLQDIPFLERTPVCANLTGDYVNLREHADIGSDIVVKHLRFNEAAVYRVVSMLDRERAEVGASTIWIEVTETPETEDPEDKNSYVHSGYIRGELLTERPCPP